MMEITVSDPVYLADGRINCTVDLGKGPMLYTSGPDDSAPWGPTIFEAATALGPVPYVAPLVALSDSLSDERAAMRMTRYQTVAAIYTAGLSAAADAHLAKQDYLTQLAWAETAAFSRTNALIASVAAALMLTDEQLDDLFRAGMQLTL